VPEQPDENLVPPLKVMRKRLNGVYRADSGFSGPTREAGWTNRRIAAAWVELMRRLGYERYGAVGNDAGSMISPEIGRLDPDRVVGVHVTQIFSFPSGDPAEMAGLTEEEQGELQTLQWFYTNKFSFNTLMAQQPLAAPRRRPVIGPFELLQLAGVDARLAPRHPSGSQPVPHRIGDRAGDRIDRSCSIDHDAALGLPCGDFEVTASPAD